MAGRRRTPEGRSAGAVAGAATKRRKAFEAADPERMRTISDVQFGTSGRTTGDVGVSPKLAYHLMGLHSQEPQSPHPHGQQELPGMTSRRTGIESGLIPRHAATTLPDLAPSPTPWHEMSREDQHHTLKMAAQFGVTPESMHHSFAAQLDQAHLHAARHGMTPYASHFYSGDDPSRTSTPEEMQPRDRIHESARQNEVPFSTQVLGNAKTSAKTKFRQVSAGSGEVRYPNDEAATVAVRAAQAGTPHTQVRKPSNLQALEGNVQRATYMATQHLAGTPLDEVRNPPSKTTPEGSEPFGPKTGPYANSFLDPHGSSQFFVSDVHSGGAGMAPHIPHEAPFKRHPETGEILLSKEGRPKRDQSERENYLAIPGIHALHNHVAQQVIHERGLNSLSGAQGAQWGEEQVTRATVDRGARKVTLVAHDDAYKRAPMHEEVHGQMDIFGGEAHHGSTAAHLRPANVTEMPEGQERDRAERAAAAIRNNTIAKRRREGRSHSPSYSELGNEPYEGWA